MEGEASMAYKSKSILIVDDSSQDVSGIGQGLVGKSS